MLTVSYLRGQMVQSFFVPLLGVWFWTGFRTSVVDGAACDRDEFKWFLDGLLPLGSWSVESIWVKAFGVRHGQTAGVLLRLTVSRKLRILGFCSPIYDDLWLYWRWFMIQMLHKFYI